jgi:hypothetical protein
MGSINVEQVREGMELAADVADGNGQLLAREGTVVSDSLLRLFKMWGVNTVEVVGEEESTGEAEGGALAPEIRAEHEEAARDLFRHADLEHPLTALLLRECTERIARGARSHG